MSRRRTRTEDCIALLSGIKWMMLEQAAHAHGFMQLLMKRRNGLGWTVEDKIELKGHFKQLAKALPVFGIFTLPGGMLLLPLLALFLERRKTSRGAASGDPRSSASSTSLP